VVADKILRSLVRIRQVGEFLLFFPLITAFSPPSFEANSTDIRNANSKCCMTFALETSKILNVCFLGRTLASPSFSGGNLFIFVLALFVLGLSSAFELLGLFPFGPCSCTFRWCFLPFAVAAGVGVVLCCC
jgi:hypothetical protein